MVKKYVIRIDGKFVKEEYPYATDCGMYLIDNIDKATQYKSIYEFLVALRYVKFGLSSYNIENKLNKEKIQTIELIAIDTLKSIKIDFNKIKKAVKKYTKDKIALNDRDFRLYMNCFYGSSHWMYDENDNWIAFPKGKDFDNITKIIYYKRGLIDILDDVFHYRNASVGIPSCYRFYTNRLHLMNDILFRIALSETDSCSKYTLYKQRKD